MAKENFECLLCDRRKALSQKGNHLGICKDCVRIIKSDWPEEKDVVVVSDIEASTKGKK